MKKSGWNNTEIWKARERQWTPTRAKAQDTRASPNSLETHLVRKWGEIGHLWALTPWINGWMDGFPSKFISYWQENTLKVKEICHSCWLLWHVPWRPIHVRSSWQVTCSDPAGVNPSLHWIVTESPTMNFSDISIELSTAGSGRHSFFGPTHR